MTVALKRVYEGVEGRDGYRVLVDRLWPRGVAKSDGKVDLWLKDIAPSTPLRKWFGHDPSKFEEFAERYRDELDANVEAVEALTNMCREHPKITLLYGAKDQEHNHAIVLRDYLVRQIE
ncbi:DNA-3-methyladenine glycosylase [Bifidobacterium commune]|uniref:Uncharacterized conserved protein YeaO, DUF488 family n=1 Tax=Bifidobacterium commune TaxID=1505727 RepID=A0A1C4H3H8_9BIFI|nr:DUF488 domain-containing protein [Bifidobacterium commune]MBB2954994.1 DNA-3-methyladenine glycosylase [Bifidobacterium commune]SCC79210.1 Uncharacterized conserved protein YeaO, DUF488 family [Bifidobacterium commune]